MEQDETTDGTIETESEVPEWICRYKGGEEDAYETMRAWIFDTPWAKNKVRVPTQAIQVRDIRASEGHPVLWKHNSKTDGDEIEASFRAFCDGMLLEDSDEPMRYTWLISRGFYPELANFDSPRTFQLLNRAALETPPETGRISIAQAPVPPLQIPSTGDLDLPKTINALNQFAEGSSKRVERAYDYTFQRVTEVLDYCCKIIERHPDAQDRIHERDHELARMKLEAELQREPGYVQVAGKIAAPAVNGVMALSKTNPELAAKFADVIAAFAPGAGGDE